MPSVVQKKDVEIKSVWVNGEYIQGPVEAVKMPTMGEPFWRINLKNGDFLMVTGHVIVKQGPNPLSELSGGELPKRFDTIQKEVEALQNKTV